MAEKFYYKSKRKSSLPKRRKKKKKPFLKYFFVVVLILAFGFSFFRFKDSFYVLDFLEKIEEICPKNYRQKLEDAFSFLSSINPSEKPCQKVLSAEHYFLKRKERTPFPVSFSPYFLTIYPAAPVKNGSLSSPFGKRLSPISGREEIHHGIDIASPFGEEVFSSFDGACEGVGENDLDGKFVLISHGEKVKTLYCHLSDVCVCQGQKIKRGEKIGNVGSTGQSTGSHLHFEIIINGKSCNPVFAF